ncbi:hypothetical protein [Vibrio alfacsensis]|uniref:hypothetical protein n=1 Tax=Vibrio alfacsensis TaxID=1074311 RepID=UPI004068A790
MKYWWVSQNSTFKQESSGGYLWSPKVNKNGSASQFYDNMTRVSVGDIVLSFESSLISAISVVTRTAYSAHKPDEFGAAGDAWSDEGWKVDLDYHFLTNRVRPADYTWIALGHFSRANIHHCNQMGEVIRLTCLNYLKNCSLSYLD